MDDKTRPRTLRERAEQDGVHTLSEAELAAVALGIPLARALSVCERVDLRYRAAVELGRRVVSEGHAIRSRLPDRAAVVAWANARLATLEYEELWILCLDGRHGLKAARMVASGGIHGLHVGVRDALRIAVREGASAFVLVHNHPSGDPEPSEEDVAFTRAVVRGANEIGTPCLDHVVVACGGRSASLLERGSM